MELRQAKTRGLRESGGGATFMRSSGLPAGWLAWFWVSDEHSKPGLSKCNSTYPEQLRLGRFGQPPLIPDRY
jgi:hypothetical protein